EQALTTLRREYDLVIIEGAGSPVELNLASYDLVNMHIAHLAEAPVLLVGDIDRGGIFAALLGTLMLLSPADRARVRGLIVNKFRGDLSLWRSGEKLLEERSGVPVLGTIPFFKDMHIAEEDSVALDEGTASVVQPHLTREHANDLLEIVVVRLPYLSNYDEFDALALEPIVRLRFAAQPSEFPERPNLIILPGTKNTLADLAWLWQQGLVQHIRRCARQGSAILGICGGYQMLGERVLDLAGVEAAAGVVEPGLNLLPVETVFSPLSEKTTRLSNVQLTATSARGILAHLHDQNFPAYQIHLGRTTAAAELTGGYSPMFTVNGTDVDGWLSPDGWCAGCYLHGLFENDGFRHAVLAALAGRSSLRPGEPRTAHFDRQREYDKLADALCQHLDLARLKALCHLI
ncbi:MAG: cobyric acid synthase, partial [Ktedonobacteraceae bacterium]|nr:cobyric acid synthase [Ktedonobacteraceae bacterium]